MKRVLSIFTILVMLILLVGCGGGSSDSSSSETGEDTASKSDWYIPEVVDEFGDAVEDADEEYKYICTTSYGDFSNTATSKSDLTVEVTAVIPSTNLPMFAFRLLEYNKTPATYLDSSDITMKIKGGDNEVSEFRLHGFAPNGEVFLYGSAQQGEDGFFRELRDGNDIKCIIYIDSSQYNFNVSAAGFNELYNSARGIVEGEKTVDANSAINNILNQQDGSEYLIETLQYLSENRESYSLLSDDEIKKEIDGDFYYVSFDIGSGTVLTWRYIMNYDGNERTQKLYFKEGINTKTPEEQDTSSKYDINGGIEMRFKYEVRKIADGYYVLYGQESKEGDYTVPKEFLMKVHFDEDSSQYVADYPIP